MNLLMYFIEFKATQTSFRAEHCKKKKLKKKLLSKVNIGLEADHAP